MMRISPAVVYAVLSCISGVDLAATQPASDFHHDDRRILASAQGNAGEVWAVGAHPESLLRWQNDTWLEVSDASDWDGSSGQRRREGYSLKALIEIMGPDQAGVLALWPSPKGGVESLWASLKPEPRREAGGSEEGDSVRFRTTRLYHYRHTIEQLRVRLREASCLSQVAPASTQYGYGDAWTAEPLRHLMPHADGIWMLASKQASVDSLGLRHLSSVQQERALAEFPATGLKARRLYQPRAVLDRQGAVWLWGETSPWSRDQKLPVPRFFTRFQNENYDFAPVIEGLPATGEVTEFALLPGGTKAVAAVAGNGLWTVDLQAPFRATARSSPPLPRDSEIWSWQGWSDGMEVVLASDPDEPNRPNHQAFWAVLWLKTGDTWTERGRLRVDTWQGYGLRQIPADGLKWIRWDDHLILTGNRRLHVLPLLDPATAITPLDWRHGFATARPKAAYAISEGDELLVVGASSTRFRRGELSARLAVGPSPIMKLEDCLRGADGHLFAIVTHGPGKRRLAHWDGRKLIYHPLPAEAIGGSLLQDATGRLWLVHGPDMPVWTLDPVASTPEWKRHASLLDLVAEYSRRVGPSGTKDLRSLMNSHFVLPAWSADGRALVRTAHQQYQLLLPEGWVSLPKLEGGRGAERVGFSEEGTPEVFTRSDAPALDNVWRWRQSEGWQAAGTVPSIYGQRSAAAAKPAAEVPEWIERALGPVPPLRLRPTIIAENDHRWWVLYDRRVWRAESGEVRPALRVNCGHPWVEDMSTSLMQTVETDAIGNRYLWYYDEVVILPPQVLMP